MMNDEYQSMAANGIIQQAWSAGLAWQDAAAAHSTPAAIWKPKLSIDGNQWCALYGENLQDGVAGFGTSPEKAMSDFNRAWYADLAKELV
jgi:hypothetical protein